MTLLDSVVTQLQDDDSLLHNPLVAEQLAGAVTTAFVLAVVPETDRAATIRPRTVKRVLDRIHAEPAMPWTSADMAEVAGVSVRRLQEAFREYVGVSPREYVLDVRLDRIHAELSAGGDVSVTDIALRWGITHTGRFAAAYRRRFGRLSVGNPAWIAARDFRPCRNSGSGSYGGACDRPRAPAPKVRRRRG